MAEVRKIVLFFEIGMCINDIREIEGRILRSSNPYAAVGEYALKITSLSDQEGEMAMRFASLVKERGLEDTSSVEASYLFDLFSERSLLFEEVAKVFSLLEELVALDRLGLRLPDHVSAKVSEEFARWLKKNRKKVRTIARELVAGGADCEMWFYRQALEG